MMSRPSSLVLLLTFLSALASASWAQIPTKGNVFFGYSYDHTAISQGDSGSLNGWDASLEGKMAPFIGLVLDSMATTVHALIPQSAMDHRVRRRSLPTSPRTTSCSDRESGLHNLSGHPKSGSSAHLVKGEDERVRGGTSGVSRAMRKYCGIRVSWVAEVIFRFAYEPVAVAVPRGSPGGAADCRSRPHHLSCARVSSGGSLSGVYPPVLSYP